MNGQTFDFDAFNATYNQAMEGFRGTMAACKSVVPAVQDVAAQVGSEKLKRTSESWAQVTEETHRAMESLEVSAEEVKVAYDKFNNAVN